MNDTQKTIIEQINHKELNMANFSVMTNGDNAILIKKGRKTLNIEYDYETDTYNVTITKISKTLEISSEKDEGVYFDNLQNLISEFFNFEYVMEGIIQHKEVN